MEVTKTQITTVVGIIVMALIKFNIIGPADQQAANELLVYVAGCIIMAAQFFQRGATKKLEKMMGQRLALQFPYTPPEPPQPTGGRSTPNDLINFIPGSGGPKE